MISLITSHHSLHCSLQVLIIKVSIVMELLVAAVFVLTFPPVTLSACYDRTYRLTFHVDFIDSLFIYL